MVVFIDLKADVVSRDRVWGFLTWKDWKIEADLRDGRTIALWPRRTKLDLWSTFARTQTVMRNNSCRDILAGEEGVAARLASEPRSSFLKMVRDEKGRVLREAGYTL